MIVESPIFRSSRETAEFLGISEYALARERRSGRFPHHVDGNRIVFTQDDILLGIDAMKAASPQDGALVRSRAKRRRSY